MTCRFCEYGEPKSRTRPGHHEIDYMGSISYPECRKEMKMFYGNKKTKVLHKSKQDDACRASEIKKGNLEKFGSVMEATAEGYRKCKICFRDDLLADDLRF